MSVLSKKGQRALTHKQQKRHHRTLLTKRRWKAYRAFLHYTTADTRDPMDRAFRGIVGRQSEKQRDDRAYKRIMRNR
jgi:hypothetical protein